jgi:hypothetical protein
MIIFLAILLILMFSSLVTIGWRLMILINLLCKIHKIDFNEKENL